MNLSGLTSHLKNVLIVFVLSLLIVFVSCSDDDFVNTPPTISNQSFDVGENAESGTIIGNVIATDPDQGQQLTYSILAGNLGNAFSISSGGVLSLATPASLEGVLLFELLIEVEDDLGGKAEAMISIDVLDQNDIHVVDDQSFSIVERSAIGSVVGTIVVVDEENGTFDYLILSGNADGIFEMSNDGEITVASQCDLDFDMKNQHIIEVMISDVDFEVEATITIDVVETNVVDNGLIAYYSFDGDAKDEQVNSYDGEVLGAQLNTDINGCSNSAYSFDGVDDRIDVDGLVSSVSSNTTGSFSFWIRVPDNTPVTPTTFLSFGDTNGRTYIIAYLWTDGLLRFSGVKDNAESFVVISNNIEVSNDTWHHLVYVQDGIQPKIYVDGEMISTDNFTSTDLGFWHSDQTSIDNASIGVLDQNNIVQWYMDGDMDNLRIYDRALEASEIDELYASGL